MNDKEFLSLIYQHLSELGFAQNSTVLTRLNRIIQNMPLVILNQKGEKSPQDLEKE